MGRITNWVNSDERYRWTVAALLEAEVKMRKINGSNHIKSLGFHPRMLGNSRFPSPVPSKAWSADIGRMFCSDGRVYPIEFHLLRLTHFYTRSDVYHRLG